MKNARTVLSLLVLGTVLPLYGGNDIYNTVKVYANFYNRNSSDTLESFKKCFVPEERGNVYALPSAQEKSVWIPAKQ